MFVEHISFFSTIKRSLKYALAAFFFTLPLLFIPIFNSILISSFSSRLVWATEKIISVPWLIFQIIFFAAQVFAAHAALSRLRRRSWIYGLINFFIFIVLFFLGLLFYRQLTGGQMIMDVEDLQLYFVLLTLPQLIGGITASIFPDFGAPRIENFIYWLGKQVWKISLIVVILFSVFEIYHIFIWPKQYPTMGVGDGYPEFDRMNYDILMACQNFQPVTVFKPDTDQYMGFWVADSIDTSTCHRTYNPQSLQEGCEEYLNQASQRIKNFYDDKFQERSDQHVGFVMAQLLKPGACPFSYSEPAFEEGCLEYEKQLQKLTACTENERSKYDTTTYEKKPGY